MKTTIRKLKGLVREAFGAAFFSSREAMLDEFNSSEEGQSAWRKARLASDEWEGAQALLDEFRMWATTKKRTPESVLDAMEEWLAEEFAGGLA